MDEREDHALERVEVARSILLDKYLGFEFAGLRFGFRDLEAEVVVGTGLEKPDRPPGSIQLWIVAAADDELVGEAARSIFSKKRGLTISHRQLRIRRPELRRRGFGKALLKANVAWYKAAGIVAIQEQAEGDGSLFAARHGFDFDLDLYGTSSRYSSLPTQQWRLRAVRDMMERGGVHETVVCQNAPVRESVAEMFARLEGVGGEGKEALDDFRTHLPTRDLAVEDDPFVRPIDIATHGTPLDALEGQSIGRAFLARTSWSGIRFIDSSA